MICNTLIRTDPDGHKHYKEKKAYNSLDEAIAEAKKLNALPKQIGKLVGYKCTYCCKYHIGRNGKDLTQKEKDKYYKETLDNVKFKVVGKIDLSKIR